MALSRVKTWNAAETLTASDLNAEFNNICNHFGSLDNDDINSTATFTMGELIVGSGITSADGGQLHVHTASAGTIQAVADADEAVFENSAASGITILSGTSSTGMIAFGDSGDADIGKISYSHSSNGYTITANAATALQISSAGAVTTGGSVLSDTDSTDSLGSASVRWANLYVDSIGDTGQALAITAGTNAINLTAGDVTLYDDNNNADTSISMGTSATEALVVQALNGGSNKTLEELRLTTKTASGTADHGKVTVYVDEAHIADVDDSGINLASGKTFRINGTNVVASAGDFSGPGSATDNAVVRFDGTGGKTAQNSGVTIDDSNNATGFANLTLSGELDAATGDFSGDVDVDGTMEADAITIGGTAIGSIYGAIAGSSSIVTTGALDSGSITSGFGTIDTGSSSITTTGAISSGALTATGNVSLNGGSFVFNESGADKDFRIEGDSNQNLFVADASTDRIGIGVAAPDTELHVHAGDAGHASVTDFTTGLTVEDDQSTGIVIATPAGYEGKIYFADPGHQRAGAIIYNHPSDYLAFQTANTERLRIDSSGNLRIVSTANAVGRLNFADPDDTDVGRVQYDHSSNSMEFYANAAERMRLTSAGNLGIAMDTPSHKLDVTGTAGLSTGTAWTNTSDARIKTDVTTITGATEKLKQLRPVSFRYTDQYLSIHDEIDGSKTYHSFVADEYETVFPNAVSVQGDLVKITPGVDEVQAQDAVLYLDGDTDIPDGKSVGDVRTPAAEAVEGRDEVRETLLTDLKQFTPHDLQMFLTAAIQELDARITALEAA